MDYGQYSWSLLENKARGNPWTIGGVGNAVYFKITRKMMYDTGLTSDRMPHTLIYRSLAQTLKAAYEQLQADLPTNEWTQRAYPYRLL